MRRGAFMKIYASIWAKRRASWFATMTISILCPLFITVSMKEAEQLMTRKTLRRQRLKCTPTEMYKERIEL
jgi:hypothetical protein